MKRIIADADGRRRALSGYCTIPKSIPETVSDFSRLDYAGRNWLNKNMPELYSYFSEQEKTGRDYGRF